MEHLKIEISNRIGFITLNRAEKKNALSHELVKELRAAFKDLEHNDEVKVVVLRASGNVFCSGADLSSLSQLQENTYQENLDDSNFLKGLFLKIWALEKPVIAEVQGHAIAGGAGLATVCDFVFLSSEAKMGYTEVKIGFIPALVSVFLVKKIGEGRAREMLLSGQLYDAETLAKYNVVTEVVEPTQLSNRVVDFAHYLCKNNSGESMRQTIKMLAELPSLPLKEALSKATELNARSRATGDFKKGIETFLAKKKLEW